MKVQSSTVLVIVLISSRRVSATVAWLHQDHGEKVVAHKAIDCVWHQLSERGRLNTVADVVKLACESAGVEAYSAYIACSDSDIQSQLASGYADLGQDMVLTASDRDQALVRARHQAVSADRQLLHALPVHWTVRSRQGEREVTDPVGQRGSRIISHVLLVTAPQGYGDGLAALLDQCGLHCDGVIAPPVALWHGIAGKLRNRGTTLIIDCGARTTALIVHRKGQCIHIETHAFGGDTLTDAIAAELGISFDQAEDLKREVDLGVQVAGNDLEGQQYLWRDVQERHRLIAPAGRICAGLIRAFFSVRARDLRDREFLGQQGQVNLVGRASALGGLAMCLRDIFDLPVVLGTGQRDRDPSAELADLIVSGIVRTAADGRRQELAGHGSGLGTAARGMWAWLTKTLE